MATKNRDDRMGLPLKSVLVRIDDEAYALLVLMSDAEQKDYGKKAGELLARTILGEGHAIKVAALRYARSETVANARKDSPTRAKRGDE